MSDNGVLNVPASTKQYIELEVSVDETIPDLTTLPVVATLAEIGSAPPAVVDWKTAAWAGSANHRKIRLLVGTGSDFGPLVAGKDYRMWVQVTGNPERPHIVSDNRIHAY